MPITVMTSTNRDPSPSDKFLLFRSEPDEQLQTFGIPTTPSPSQTSTPLSESVLERVSEIAIIDSYHKKSNSMPKLEMPPSLPLRMRRRKIIKPKVVAIAQTATSIAMGNDDVKVTPPIFLKRDATTYASPPSKRARSSISSKTSDSSTIATAASTTATNTATSSATTNTPDNTFVLPPPSLLDATTASARSTMRPRILFPSPQQLKKSNPEMYHRDFPKLRLSSSSPSPSSLAQLSNRTDATLLSADFNNNELPAQMDRTCSSSEDSDSALRFIPSLDNIMNENETDGQIDDEYVRGGPCPEAVKNLKMRTDRPYTTIFSASSVNHDLYLDF